jgi:histidine triad (HIT) family protein
MKKMDCVFCKIANGEISAEILYQDEEAIAFRDANPRATTHILIIPKKHIPSLAEISEDEIHIAERLIKVAHNIAKEGGIAERGYRLVVNTGKEWGQEIQHLHLHLLSNEELK